jgi:hypothetical protein
MTVRRLKTYGAETGYVYEYYFVGRREALAGDPEAPANEYVFDVTVAGGAVFAISVFLRADALAAWASSHGRALTEAEQYAAAKVRLLQDLDEIETPANRARRATITPENVEELLAGLGLEG